MERGKILRGMFDIGYRADHLPRQLSSGEKRRAAVARALTMNPDLVPPDEPAAYLDFSRSSGALRPLRTVACDLRKTVVMVCYDLRTRDVANRLLWLEDARFQRAPPV